MISMQNNYIYVSYLLGRICRHQQVHAIVSGPYLIISIKHEISIK